MGLRRNNCCVCWQGNLLASKPGSVLTWHRPSDRQVSIILIFLLLIILQVTGHRAPPKAYGGQQRLIGIVDRLRPLGREAASRMQRCKRLLHQWLRCLLQPRAASKRASRWVEEIG